MNLDILREIVRSLMESRFYFSLSLKERHHLVKHVFTVFAQIC